MEWASRVKKYRGDNFLSQEQLAEILDVDQTTISRWERSVSLPSQQQQVEIATLLRPVELISDEVLKFLLNSQALISVTEANGGAVVAISNGIVSRQGIARSDVVGHSCKRWHDPRTLESFVTQTGRDYAPREFLALSGDTFRWDHTRETRIHMRYNSRVFQMMDGRYVRVQGYSLLSDGDEFENRRWTRMCLTTLACFRRTRNSQHQFLADTEILINISVGAGKLGLKQRQISHEIIERLRRRFIPAADRTLMPLSDI